MLALYLRGRKLLQHVSVIKNSSGQGRNVVRILQSVLFIVR